MRFSVETGYHFQNFQTNAAISEVSFFLSRGGGTFSPSGMGWLVQTIGGLSFQLFSEYLSLKKAFKRIVKISGVDHLWSSHKCRLCKPTQLLFPIRQLIGKCAIKRIGLAFLPLTIIALTTGLRFGRLRAELFGTALHRECDLLPV